MKFLTYAGLMVLMLFNVAHADELSIGIKEAKPAQWRYLRLKFRIWPGQGALIETAFKQRVIAAMKQIYPEYADWMVIVTYRVE